MYAQPLVLSLNALYLAPMALLSLVGTATLVKLIAALLRSERRPSFSTPVEVEDA